jgi:hypothetical protein
LHTGATSASRAESESRLSISREQANRYIDVVKNIEPEKCLQLETLSTRAMFEYAAARWMPANGPSGRAEHTGIRDLDRRADFSRQVAEASPG